MSTEATWRLPITKKKAILGSSVERNSWCLLYSKNDSLLLAIVNLRFSSKNTDFFLYQNKADECMHEPTKSNNIFCLLEFECLPCTYLVFLFYISS